MRMMDMKMIRGPQMGDENERTEPVILAQYGDRSVYRNVPKLRVVLAQRVSFTASIWRTSIDNPITHDGVDCKAITR